MIISTPSGSELEPVTVTLTFSLDTNIYANNDLLADTQELAGVFARVGGMAKLSSIFILDEDDVGQVFDLIFVNDNTSLGTENSAPNISDANAAKILGNVNVPAASYIDIGGAKIVTLNNVGLWLKSAASTSVWVGIVNGTGTPTFTAGGLKAKFTFER